MNELSFLKDVEKTPTFIVYSKKKNQFKIVALDLKPEPSKAERMDNEPAEAEE